MMDRPRLTRILTAIALLAIVGPSTTAHAQDDDEDEAPAAAVVRQRNILMMNQRQLDQWIFGNLGMGSAEAAREKVEALLKLQVEEVSRSCELTAARKKKLLLAGRGDIKRFFDRAEAVRHKYLSDPNFNFNQQIQRVWQEVQPLQAAFQAGLFGEGSIYAKTTRATLTPEQAKKYEEATRNRTLYRYWARVDLCLELLNNTVGFTDEQREKLLKLLREETKPPRRLAGRNDYYIALYQLGKIPEPKIRPIFESDQWPVIDRQIQQGRGFGGFLRQQGCVFDEDEPNADRPAAAKTTRKRQESRK